MYLVQNEAQTIVIRIGDRILFYDFGNISLMF